MHRSLIALLLFAVSASATTAQVLRGTVRDPAGLPISGVFVTLMDADGRLRVGALTDSLGRFFVQPATGGSFTLRAERIGYQTITQPVAVALQSASNVQLQMHVNALRLREISVTRRRRCTNGGESAKQAVLVWEEARKALSIAAWVDRQSRGRFRTRMSEEFVTTDGKPIDYPVIAFDSARGRQAFRAATSANLFERGFVQISDAGIAYYGPDAELLISPEFTAQHCFHVQYRRDLTGLVGLGFEPVPDTKVPGIRGALWLDQQTGELKFIGYEYVSVPNLAGSEYATGRIDMARLPNGAFIVQRFTIFTPVLDPVVGRDRYRVIRLHKRVGEVLDVQLGSEKIDLVARHSLQGLVFDRDSGCPLSGVRVRVPGAPFEAVTDRAGRFRFDHVPRGRYVVEVGDTALAERYETGLRGFAIDTADAGIDIGLSARKSAFRTTCPTRRGRPVA